MNDNLTIPPRIIYPTTDAEWCAYFKYMDVRFRTEKASPLHHDNRCSICK